MRQLVFDIFLKTRNQNSLIDGDSDCQMKQGLDRPCDKCESADGLGSRLTEARRMQILCFGL